MNAKLMCDQSFRMCSESIIIRQIIPAGVVRVIVSHQTKSDGRDLHATIHATDVQSTPNYILQYNHTQKSAWTQKGILKYMARLLRLW